MDIGTWCKSGDGNLGGWCRSRSERGYDQFLSYNLPGNYASKAPIWRLLWRKLKKEKKRMFYCTSSDQFTYDPYTYAQNFDQGSTWADADDLSRSFSARFAVPSRIFDQQNGLVV